MSTTAKKMVSNGFTMNVTVGAKSADLRQVYVHMPHVAPPGADWSSDHGGRFFELTSYKGGPVEMYVRNSEGVYMYQGTVRSYAPGESLQNAFRAAWRAMQPSQAARESFEVSASTM